MINQYLLVFLKYTLFYFYFYLVGSSLLSVFSKFFNKNTLDNKVLYLKINYLYPLVGFVFLSNKTNKGQSILIKRYFFMFNI